MTTNQSESINHVIKNYVSWKKTNIAELINTLKSIVKFHYNNLKCAIFDQGDYKTNNSFSYHQFQAFSEQVKNKHYKDLINNSFKNIVSDTGKKKFLQTCKVLLKNLVAEKELGQHAFFQKHN